MEGRISILLVVLACIPAILGFRVFMPYPVSYESSLEPVANPLIQRNNPGLLLLHGPAIPSESESEASENEPIAESESELPESEEEVAGGIDTGGQAVQANPGFNGGAANGGQAIAVPGMGGAGQAGGNQARGNAFSGNPQQISSEKGSGAVGVGVAVGVCFLAVVAVGVAVYVIRQRRQNRNMERLE